jgi:hypothetical protein
VPDLQRLLHPEDDDNCPSHDIVLLLPESSSDGGDTDTAAAADMVRVPAHRCVLAALSDEFRAMFEGGFSEGGFAGGSGDGTLQEVALPHWGAPAFRAFLTYAYSGALG